MALRTTCIKNVKLKIIKLRAACQYVDYFYYGETWAGLRVGHSCCIQITRAGTTTANKG